MAKKKAVSRDSMLAYIKEQEIKVKKVEKKTDDELEEIVTDHLKELELAFECGECSRDVPDVDNCPYCGASFNDEGVEEAGKKDDEEEVEEEGEEEGEEDGEEDGEEKKDDDDETPPAKPDKKADKDKGTKPGKPEKADKPKQDKANKPAEGPSLFEAAVKQADVIAKADGLKLQEKKIYFAWYKDGTKVFAINKNRKVLQAFFHPEKLGTSKVAKKIKGFEAITAEVAKERHYGSVRAVYEGQSVEDLVALVKELVS